MKKIFLLIFIGSVWMACHSDIDLNNIDPTAELEIGAALPVGSIRARLGDFAGKVDNLLIDTANGGVLVWRDTFAIYRDYHKFDIKDHISSTDLSLNVYKKAEAEQILINGKITGNDNIHPVLHFDLPLHLKDINKELGNERLDSALIESARFHSIIDTTSLPFKWEWIDEVMLVLGEQVSRKAGNTKVIYRKGQPGGFGQEISTEIDNFSINLMKNRNLSIEKNTYMEYEQNVIDSVVFGVDFKFTVPTSAGQITIPTSARFKYHLELEFVDFTALWGFFEPSKDMFAEQEDDLSESWESLEFLKRSCTPFTDPIVDMQVRTKIAGAMMMKGHYAYVTNLVDPGRIYATFDANGSHERPAIEMIPYMHPDPTKPGSAIGDSVRTSVIFNKDEDKGHIDHMFQNMPQKVGYKFEVYFNTRETPQIRITPDTRVAISAVCTLPLKFADGLFVDYNDTIKDIDLSQVAIDSLLKEVDYIDTLKTTDVNLYMTALSEIPLTVKAILTYLDEKGQPLKDPADPSKLFNPFLEDTIRINPPRYEKNSLGGWIPVEQGKSIFTAQLTKEKLNMMPQIKAIIYHVIIDNASLAEAYKDGLSEIPLTDKQRLELNIGLTAKIDAVMKFNK